MGKLKALGYAKLDARIQEFGADNVAMDIATKVACGESPAHIAKTYEVPYMVIREFMEGHADKMSLARRAYSDVLVHDALSAVDDADMENVQLARLKADTYLKVAGKQDRAQWGDGGVVGVGGGGGIRIVIGYVGEVGEVGATDVSNIIDAEVISGE
jgi:hypothetical protein